MTESEKAVELEHKETSCYTYEVSMIIQIFAKDEVEAKERLDRDGGYISKRDVKLKDAVHVYSGEITEAE
jgi:hypothetical protein